MEDVLRVAAYVAFWQTSWTLVEQRAFTEVADWDTVVRWVEVIEGRLGGS